MTDKFKNKYRITSHRKPGWDYSSNGYYFITLVTQNRQCNLGQIVHKNGRAYLELSPFGKIIDNEWKKSFEIRNELFLNVYIVMPNHLHAIVILKHPDVFENNNCEGIPLQTKKRSINSSFIRKPKSLSSFISGFKSAINSKIDDYIDENNLNIPKYNRYNHFFQSNYYDHIIRNKQSHQNISTYIINNPRKWWDDRFNPDYTK